jgi:hypothetical protein
MEQWQNIDDIKADTDTLLNSNKCMVPYGEGFYHFRGLCLTHMYKHFMSEVAFLKISSKGSIGFSSKEEVDECFDEISTGISKAKALIEQMKSRGFLSRQCFQNHQVTRISDVLIIMEIVETRRWEIYGADITS